ncbi:hypothetical protein [Erwinia amylovora]|uniref:hypothetical protein n=1 Tax=Erwinia amylovora TaxID=552 RepID=UPI0014445D74|nr:hypothetical protein [Erwinia amylovora]
MNRTNFKEIMKDIVSERFDEENEALSYLVSTMRCNGYDISKNDYYLCCVRGGFNMTKLSRIQNYHKGFKAHQIRGELKLIYDHIKDLNKR